MATINGKPLMSLRVVDLKDELEKRGLSKSGAKEALVQRLEEYILEHEKSSKTKSFNLPKVLQNISGNCPIPR